MHVSTTPYPHASIEGGLPTFHMKACRAYVMKVSDVHLMYPESSRLAHCMRQMQKSQYCDIHHSVWYLKIMANSVTHKAWIQWIQQKSFRENSILRIHWKKNVIVSFKVGTFCWENTTIFYCQWFQVNESQEMVCNFLYLINKSPYWVNYCAMIFKR